jgi:hypothetical protein
LTKLTGYYDPLTIGVDIETGEDMCFSYMLPTQQGMTERTFINETTWLVGVREICDLDLIFLGCLLLENPKSLEDFKI